MEIKKAVEAVEKKTGIDLPDEKIEKLASKENIEVSDEEFNKEVFLKNVDYISVPKRDVLEFHFKNGEIKTEIYRP